MATRLKDVDAVMVGMGWTGSIMARELTKAGLHVVGLERGANRVPSEDFALPAIRDELKYRLRFQLMLDNATETLTMRHMPNETAAPMRRWGAFRWATASAARARIGTVLHGARCRRNCACAAI